MRKSPAGCPCRRYSVRPRLAAECQAVRQYDVSAVEDNVANIDVRGLRVLVLVLPHVVVLVHKLDEDRVSSSPVLQFDHQPVCRKYSSSLVLQGADRQ